MCYAHLCEAEDAIEHEVVNRDRVRELIRAAIRALKAGAKRKGVAE